MKTHHTFYIPILFTFAMVLFTGACSEDAPPTEAVARPVKLLTIGGLGAGGILEYPGKIATAQNAEMAFEVSGKINYPAAS